MISPIFNTIIFIVIISMSIIINLITRGMTFLILFLVMVLIRANTVLLVRGPVDFHLMLLLPFNLLFIIIIGERSGIFFFISLDYVFLSTVYNIIDVLVMITLISRRSKNFLLFFILFLLYFQLLLLLLCMVIYMLDFRLSSFNSYPWSNSSSPYDGMRGGNLSIFVNFFVIFCIHFHNLLLQE
jgi:hypothetical protein